MIDLGPKLNTIFDRIPEFIKNPSPNIYRSNNYVYVDFETTNTDFGTANNRSNRLVCAVWINGSEPNRINTHIGGEYSLNRLVGDIERADYFIAHNTKFEYGWLKRCGLDITSTLAYDTMIAEYQIAGNRKWRLSLDKCLERYGMEGKESLVGKMIKAGICPSEIPIQWLTEYCKVDVIQGHKLFLAQREEIYKRGLEKVTLTANLFTVPLVEIESQGMCLDKERVDILHGKFSSELEDLQYDLDLITGGINSKSTKQMRDFLYNTMEFSIPVDYRKKQLLNKPNKDWPDGAPKVDKATILKLHGKTKEQRDFLKLLTKTNALKDSKSKTIDKFYACCDNEPDNILYASLNQTRTSTHRLSSSGLHYKCQFQNFDRRFKPLFKARNEGWMIGEADEASLEYRGAVFLGNDDAGRYDIANNIDAHSYTASIVFRDEWEKINGDRYCTEGKKIRTASKEHTFKPLFAGSSGTEAQKEYYQAFKDKHVGITKTLDSWISEVYRTKKLTTATGLVFYWEDAKLNRQGKMIRPDGRLVDQSVCNAPIQYLSTGEIVPIAVIYTYHMMKAAQMESFLVNTIHDSVIGEIHPEEGNLFRKIVDKTFKGMVVWYLKEVYGIDFNVPLEQETDIFDHWATSKAWEEEWLNE